LYSPFSYDDPLPEFVKNVICPWSVCESSGKYIFLETAVGFILKKEHGKIQIQLKAALL
jgi:hypothetical protein